ncbi:MAG: S-layer homology domain-containing protein [Candidatus Gracilibacteria bacterium]|nr:S-layer homology domain-containing protein [Candidatus Gracilibacteria bacterium]
MYPIKTKKPYDSNNLSATANIYTTVYLGNYMNGDFREMVGSHPGVDMIPQTPNDSVVSCLGGSVVTAGTNASNGNYIVIKHSGVPDMTDPNIKTTLYSCYLHLSELSVKAGDNVSEGQIIGKTGNTGNSTGEHLHFQIDKESAPFHPYWPFTFKEAQDAGVGFFDAVNKGLNLDNGIKYTINPLHYLDAIKYRGIETSTTTVASVSTTTTVASVSDDPIVQPSYFLDVGIDDDAINYLAKAGITKGYPNGTFRGENNISRVELLAMTFTFAKTQVDSNSPSVFSDVLNTDWFCKYVMKAKKESIVSGYPDGTFKPNNPVTRIEALAIILNAVLGKANIPNVSGSLFADVENGSWYEKYVYHATSNGIFEVTGSKFSPNSPMKRKEVAEILYNLRDKV